MPKFRILPLFPDDFIADTTHLSAAELGSYTLLLLAAWRRPTCDLPDDDDFLARVARCDLRSWRSTRRAKMLAFHQLSPDLSPNPSTPLVWIQKRLRKERNFVEQLSNKNRANINARWSKNKDLGHTTVLPDAYQTDTPVPKKKEETLFTGGGDQKNGHPVNLPPEERLARFAKSISKLLGPDPWTVIANSQDPTSPSHQQSFEICARAARTLKKQMPNNWIKTE